MTESSEHYLTDEQLKQVAGGDIISAATTSFLHKDCGGEIQFLEDYDDSFLSFLSEWSGGPGRYSSFYRCAKCGKVFEKKDGSFVAAQPGSTPTPGADGYI